MTQKKQASKSTTRSNSHAVAEEGKKAPKITKRERSQQGLMRVINDTSRPHDTRVRSAEKYIKAKRERAENRRKQGHSDNDSEEEMDAEELVRAAGPSILPKK